MNTALRYIGQAVAYAAFAVFIGYFAAWPAYTRVPPDQALIKLSFSHGAERKGECRQRTDEEMARLAPNMRRSAVCPRERLPVFVELELNGKIIYADELPSTALSGDGPSQAYRRFVVPSGEQRIVARLRDTARSEGFDYIADRVVTLKPGDNLAIDFFPSTGGFRFE